MITFSVIVPFLNEERYLGLCIEALQGQTISREQYELIFIDNGSTDASAAIVKKHPDVILLNEPQKDAYIARNRGIEQARGKFILFTDADCVVSPNWLQVYGKAFQDEAIGIASGRLRFPEGGSRLIRYYDDYYATKMRMMATTLPRETCYGHAGNMGVRKELFSTLGLFSPMPIVGDAEIVQKYLTRFPESRVAYLHEAAVTHLEVNSSGALLKKLYRYGIYSQTFSRHSDFRVANSNEKLLTLCRCIKENHYSPLMQMQLIFSLVVHYFAFALGCARARI